MLRRGIDVKENCRIMNVDGAVTESSCRSEYDSFDDQSDVLEGDGIDPVEGVEMVSVTGDRTTGHDLSARWCACVVKSRKVQGHR